MSEKLKCFVVNWGLVIFCASQLFAAGGAWFRLNAVAEAQKYENALRIQSEAKSATQRDSMLEAIHELRRSNILLQERVQNLENRLKDKKLVAEIAPQNNVAGEAYKKTKQ